MGKIWRYTLCYTPRALFSGKLVLWAFSFRLRQKPMSGESSFFEFLRATKTDVWFLGHTIDFSSGIIPILKHLAQHMLRHFVPCICQLTLLQSCLTVNHSISSPVKLSGQHLFLSTHVFNKQTNKLSRTYSTSMTITSDKFVATANIPPFISQDKLCSLDCSAVFKLETVDHDCF